MLPAGSLRELERAGSIRRRSGLPPSSRRTLVRGHVGRTTMLQAGFRPGMAIENYQLETAARTVAAPTVNLLLADDVGLGKTIEAGLVVQELPRRP